jgi:hypothetical protein
VLAHKSFESQKIESFNDVGLRVRKSRIFVNDRLALSTTNRGGFQIKIWLGSEARRGFNVWE